MSKERVVLFGASGTMGYEAFKELWRRRVRYDIVILVRPSEKNKKLFSKYEERAGISHTPGKGIVENNGFKIVWGDATSYEDVENAIQGADWVFDAMAFISPQADYYPDMAKAVNTDGIINIVRAIEAQPSGKEHIRLIYTGTVAETGDRLQTIQWGRVGDPLKPSIFDYYAVTKIAGERAVVDSEIKHWVSLRMTYIMPVDAKEYLGLVDPIMFHQPLDSCMENISSRDAGYGMINALDIGYDSDFWRRAYNMGGGPEMRCTFYENMKFSYHDIMGMSGVEACCERNWFALRNFHMQYYEDSHILNEYLYYWRDSLEDWKDAIVEDMPWYFSLLTFMCKNFTPVRRLVEKATYKKLKDLAESSRNGTLHWYNHRNDMRISAFYKDYKTYESIPGWGVDMPEMKPLPQGTNRLDHGYDETKAKLDLDDLKGAAKFRGGKCLAQKWNGDMFETLEWECAFGHRFTGKPNSILKTGHWCPECVSPPWNYDEEAKKNPFFAQVWYPNHDRDEDNIYPADCVQDIAGADKD
ncbi:MAG: NAD(P)-dependent oxidoreductase [Thermodesulfobacteriota bacterium]|nr:NAD(P)-dependent oxidoreductase [Thermodesulfobacteriota bacterium]